MRIKHPFILSVCSVTLLWSACEIDPTRRIKDREKLIEHLTLVKTDSIQPLLDSICAAEGNADYQQLVDSLLAVELEKIKEKIKHYDN